MYFEFEIRGNDIGVIDPFKLVCYRVDTYMIISSLKEAGV